MKSFKMFLLFVLLSLSALANADKPKQTLQANYFVNYKIIPSAVDSLSDIFTEGMLYGRLRTNWFFYQWENEDSTHENHNILGVGGSLIYKTAPYAGLSVTTGLYYTSAGTGLDNQPSTVALLKGGKDTISRFNALTEKGKSFAVLGQAYLQYERAEVKARVGRSIFNSFFTKSNDSKMIPNTFEGLTLESKDLDKTRVRMAYLTRQKLRDHDNFHSLIMIDNRDITPTSSNTLWNGNDDSGAHLGLNYENFKQASMEENPDLIIIDGYTHALFTPKLKVTFSGLYLEDLFYTGMLELNYTFDLGNGYKLSPGVRYVQQFDDGAGTIGGASLTGLAASDTNGGLKVVRDAYIDPDSVDTYMTALRLILEKGAGSVSLGYTQIANEADFITPWRGFVTSGYTREMARYNWVANTKTYRLCYAYDFGKGKIIEGLRSYFSYTHEDYDEDKTSKNDAYLYYFGLIKKIKTVPNLSARLRIQYVDEINDVSIDHTEMRMELNYLF
ncbi:MAG: hypothetical protein COA44_06660 [Arcobacter sp.]|nr:MAG: hypothetical protein COA44_06660 [Arcobacter sp.]